MTTPTVPSFTMDQRLISLLNLRRQQFTVVQRRTSYLYQLLVNAGQVVDINGLYLELPFYLSPPAMGKWIGHDDVLPDAVPGLTAMGYASNRFFVIPSGYDQLRVWQLENSPQQLFPMLDMNAMEQAWAERRALATATFSGTGGKQPDGLGLLVEAAAPAAQTSSPVGVPRTSQAWARNPVVQMTSNFGTVAAGTKLTAGMLALMEGRRKATVGSHLPSDYVTYQDHWEMIRRGFIEMGNEFTMMNTEQDIRFGVNSFMVEGVRYGWDSDCPTDRGYFLHISQNMAGPGMVNSAKDTTKFDTDIETIAKPSFMDVTGNLTLLRHPNIWNRQIEPRNAHRRLQVASWTLTSFNLAPKRPQDNVVVYSDNGSRLHTW